MRGPHPPGDAPYTAGHRPCRGHSPNVILPLSSWSTARKRRAAGSCATPAAVLRMVDRASSSTLPSSRDPYICEAEAGPASPGSRPCPGRPGSPRLGVLSSPAGRLRPTAWSPWRVPSRLSGHSPSCLDQAPQGGVCPPGHGWPCALGLAHVDLTGSQLTEAGGPPPCLTVGRLPFFLMVCLVASK